MKYFLSDSRDGGEKEITRGEAVSLFGEQIVNMAEDSGCISQGTTFLQVCR